MQEKGIFISIDFKQRKIVILKIIIRVK